MDLPQEISTLNNKTQAQKIADYIGSDPQRFDTLMAVFYAGPYRLTQKAAWAMGHCVNKYPALILPHFSKMIKALRNSSSDAVKRNTIRAWQFVAIPDEYLDDVTDLCFTFLGSQQEPVAIKVFSMSVLLNIVRKIPELKNELRIIIEDQMPYGSAGFCSRGNKVLKALEKIPDT